MAQPCFVGGILLILFMVTQSASGQFHVTGPSTVVSAKVGEEIVLSCQLSPPMDAQNMEVRWYNLNLGLVHHYKTLQNHLDNQRPEYQGRTEFLRQNITKGQVALRIHHIRPSDEGEYSCFFSSATYYSEAQFKILVIGLGTEPHLHVEHSKPGEIKLTCTSMGWYPRPEVQWRDVKGQHLASMSEIKITEENDLFNVETSIIMDESSKGNMSCFIQNTLLSVVKEAHISLSGAFFHRINPWIVGLTVFLLLLSMFLVTIWTVYSTLLKRARKDKDKMSKELERRKLLGKEGLNRVRSFAKDVKLDENTAHPYLHVSDDRKSVTSRLEKKNLDDHPERFDTMVAVLGKNFFSSGNHYWEVYVEGKNRWTIGLCLDSISRKGRYISAHPETGFWTLCLKNGVYQALSTPRCILNVPGHIPIVGIFLQYTKGLISFYNVKECIILYTFKIKSTEILRPYFYPGPLLDGNTNGLTILTVSSTEQKSLLRKD